MEQARSLLDPHVAYAEDAYACAKGADAVVIVTEWDQFRALDLDRLAAEMTGRVLVDLRNIYRGEEIEKRGLRYTSLGDGLATLPLSYPVAAE